MVRERIRSFLSSWDKAARLRAAVIFLTGVGGAVGYARHLHKSIPFGDWLFWKIGPMWLWGLYLSLACVSAGHLVLKRALRVRGLPTLETIVHSAATGLLVFVIGMYLGGFARLYNSVFAVLCPGVMIAAGARDLLEFARERRDAWQSEPPSPRDPVNVVMNALAGAFGVFGLIFVYLGAMTPETINFDASWSHLPIAVDYARAGRIIPFDADYTRNFPHLASVVHTWPMILPEWGVLTAPPLRWMLALHLEFFFFVWTLAGVAAMTSWLLEGQKATSAWASFFLFPAIFVYDMNLGGAADHYLAFFAPPFFLAAVRASPRFEARASALAGAYGAGALLAKYQAIYLIVGVTMVFGGLWLSAAVQTLLAARAPAKEAPEGAAGTADDTSPDASPDASTDTSTEKSPVAPLPTLKELVQGPLALAAAFVLVTSPHFLKNWFFYHNPMYPFMQDVFKSRPTTPNAAYLFEWLFKDYNWRPHGTFLENVKDAFGLLYTYSFAPHYSFTRNVPNAGSLFTLCLPMALAVRGRRRIWLGYAAGLGALFAWGMIFRVDRHLQTFMPLLVATTAAVIVRAWEMGWLSRAGLFLLVGLQVIWGGDAPFYAGYQRINASIDMLRSGYEGRAKARFEGYRSADRALGAALPKDARVVLHMFRPNLGIDRDILLDWAGQQGLILYEDIHGPRNLYDFFKSLGVTHVIWIPGRRAASTKQEDVLFTDLVHRYGLGRKRYGALELVTLPKNPPPPDHPYMVLSLGLAGYRDGLYPVEAMKTYERVPENREKFAPPEVPWPRDPAAQAEMAAKADAICVGDRFKLEGQLKSKVDSLFEAGQEYPKSFTIHVRRGGAAKPSNAAPGSLVLPPDEH